MNVTIAIPTFNRSRYIGKAIESVLEQTYQDFELLVIDNASTDNTEDVVHSFMDKRIRYVKNEKNIGIIGNWNKCVQLSSGKYLTILGDDDILSKRFLEESMAVHNSHPTVGFTFAHCNKVDETGNFIKRWGYDFTPAGLIEGLDYLFYTLDYEACLTNSSTVLLKKEVFNSLEGFRIEFARNVFDFNMWIRIASLYDIFFINEVLCDYRIHDNQVSQLHWREKKTGKIGTYLELFNIISILQEKEYELKKDYVISKLRSLTKNLSEFLLASDSEL